MERKKERTNRNRGFIINQYNLQFTNVLRFLVYQHKIQATKPRGKMSSMAH